MEIERNNGDQLISDQIARNNVKEALEASNSPVSSESSKKGHAAILTGLNSVAEEVLKNSKTAPDGNPLGSIDGSVDGTDSTDGTESSDGATDSDSQGESDEDDAPPAYVDPLVASIMAGVTSLISKTDLTIATSDMQIKLSKLTTDTAKAGSDWMNNFYQYGNTDGLGTYHQGILGPNTPGQQSDVLFRINNNHGGAVEASIDGGANYYQVAPYTPNNLFGGVPVPTSAEMEKVFPGYTFDGMATQSIRDIGAVFNQHVGSLNYGDDTPFSIAMINNTTTKFQKQGSGLANADSTSLQTLMNAWSYVQQTVSSQNQTVQSTSSLPSAMQQNTSSSINNSDSSRQNIQSCLDSTASLVTGWSSK